MREGEGDKAKDEAQEPKEGGLKNEHPEEKGEHHEHKPKGVEKPKPAVGKNETKLGTTIPLHAYGRPRTDIPYSEQLLRGVVGKEESFLVLASVALPKQKTKGRGRDTTRKPPMLSEIDCHNGHKVFSDGDDKVRGVLAVKGCSNKCFANDINKSHSVCQKLSALVNGHLRKNGVKEEHKVHFVKAGGNKTHTYFHYSLNANKEHHDHIKAALREACKENETLSNTADTPFHTGVGYDANCARCGLRKIRSTLLLKGVTLKHVSSRLCGRFPQNFKYVLAAEVRKYQRVGLKSIGITSISADKQKNLIIDFDIVCDPERNEQIRDALRRAVISLDVCFSSLLVP
ncbi:unnamed protein product [Sphagnum tenellum]